ncbi:zinc-dependent alcohol dehydrogenase [Oleiharenicola lentus]|nr:alcohol dehydrogenase catalytic domain-containing protein [Oleiharenicola lentus]
MKEQKLHRVVRLHGPCDLRLETRQLRTPGDNDVIVSVGAVGVCGSDLHLYNEARIGTTKLAEPFIPGHEFMGTVVAAGPASSDALGQSLRLGQRVAIEPHIACGNCTWCMCGQSNLCPHHIFLGLPGCDGALAEQVIVPGRQCYPLPDSISDNAGALLEALGVAMHAASLARIRANEAVVVVGLGSIGLMLVRLAALIGAAPLIAVDPLPWRAKFARHWGATHTHTGTLNSMPERMRRASGPHGSPTVFETAWAGTAISDCVHAAAPGARVVLVGIPADDTFSLPHSVARRKGLTLLFSRRMGAEMPLAIRLASLSHEGVNLDELVTHEWRLDQTARAFSQNARYADGVLKSVVHPQR